MNSEFSPLEFKVIVDPIRPEEFDAAAEGLRLDTTERLPRLPERTVAALIEFAMRDESLNDNIS